MTPRFRRRELPALLGLLGLPGAASAQPARPPQPPRQPPARAVTRLPAMPCLDRAGDLASLLLEGSGAPAGTVVTFGHAFKPGDLPRGVGIAARLAGDGRALPAQLDVSRRHPDGSARIVVIALAAPAIGEGQQVGVVLSRREQGGPDGALDPAAALEGRALGVELVPDGGAAAWRADLAALFRAVPAAQRWQSGPLATQARVQARAQLGGVTSLRLVADVAVRADRSIWVDLWLRNDIAMQPGGGDVAYGARLTLDGRDLLNERVPRHWHYSGWGRLVGSAAPPPRVIHNPSHLAPSGAIMPYDLSVGMDTPTLEHLARPLADPNWDKPLHPRGLQTSMGAPGARPDLGQTTNWIAGWLVTGDARMAKMAIGQAEAAGGIPWHFWDARGGADGTGGWLDMRRWPGFWSDPRGGQPPRTLLQPAPIDSIWQRGGTPSHQPALSFVPYLLTGRRALLDNLMAQAAWNVSGVWPVARRAEGALNDVLVVRGRQTRSSAWTIRTLDEAAWVAAENDPTRAYIEEVTALNWAWLRARIPEWTATQGALHGYVEPLNFGYLGRISPWQQDYFASSAAMAALRGREDARVFLDWMRNFLVGRFFATEQGFTRNDAVAYQISLIAGPLPRPPAPPAAPHRTWAEVAEGNRAQNLGNGSGWVNSNGEYPRLGMLTLALIAHVFDDARAKEAWHWLANSDSPNAGLGPFSRAPYQTVAPPGVARLPEHAPRCTATARR